MIYHINFLVILNYQKNQINNLKNELISQQQKYNDYVTTNQLLTNNITTSITNLNTIRYNSTNHSTNR